MTRIKYKIAIPFMIMITVISIITILVFTSVMRSYILQTSKQDIKNAMETTDYLIKQQYGSGWLQRQSQQKLVDFIPRLKAALKTSRIATRTEVIAFRQKNLIYPKTYSEDTFLNDKIIEQVSSLEFDNSGKAIQIEIDNKKYLVARHPAKQDAFRLIYVISLENAYEFVNSINKALIVILALATILGLFISLLISNSISRPIGKISQTAQNIGRGQFVQIEPYKTSREIFDLCSSMNTMSQSLYQFENAQKMFLQNVSHELRTPLMSVQGYAEGIINGVFSDNVKAANVICQESKRLTSLVEELLVLSRIENKTYSMNMSEVILNNLMKEFIQRLNGLVLKTGKTLDFIEEDPNIQVCVDEELLYQAVSNLISNSLRYAKSTVAVSLYKSDKKTFIKIHDDGQGISNEDLPHIFERFYRGKNGNFGLGLSIARSAVIALDGTLEAINTDAGAIFLISLKLA